MKGQMQENVVQDAIEKTGFGKFNLKISSLGALIYANAVINILSIGYVLPAAMCDFEMTTIDKGRIAIAPVLGSCFGSLFWGFLADLKGRRISLMSALFLQGKSDILISLVSSYWALLSFKFLSGFAIIGEISLVFSYVGEFQPARCQKKILSWLSLVMVAGLIIVPLLAWAIIPLQFEYRRHYFFFRSWNLFVLVCAIPAEILGIWLIFCPETPKYLAESGQTGKLLKVLTDMYVENIRGTPEEFYRTLENSEYPALIELANSCANKSTSKEEKAPSKKKLCTMLKDFKKQRQNVFKAPYLKRLVVLCICLFCTASSFYSLLMWFPELFQRFAHFEALHPNQTASVCSISNKNSATNTTMIKNSFDCVQEINTSVYRSALWQGLTTLIPNILLPLLVDKLGFRFFAVTLLGTSVFVTSGLYFAKSYMENVILSCIFLAVMSTSLSVMYSFLVILFPTNIRVFASTISVFTSRIGTIFGNVTFTYLIDDYCTILIVTIIAQLLLAATLSLTLRA
ncbi:synaptic vesicle glycoprotein 2B-like isoform X2 [Belonocnema kinseyi]|uniref:synaptic vesicle glycoprotein 2B-like isoform X2 n=1 Tax=Belonocnema kinseyi TaxID=2817044 RepID=UPI00143CE0D5|nr:synaptic vesicle glycoprotein 2B-like isoform X2 [Belonocnema kinseyi]